MIKKVVLAIIFVLFAVNAFSATYYIDYGAANDSANGTSTDTPWKRCPGMVGFAGSYSHSNGDVFVFKGGVTWPLVTMPLTVANSGADGVEDIYTGGQEEGTPYGSGYPVFDGGNSDSIPYHIVVSGKSNIKIRYIKVSNLRHSDGSGQSISLFSVGNIEVSNMFIEPNCVNCLSWSAATGNYSKIYIHDNTIRQCGRVNISAGNSRTTDIRVYNNTMEGQWDYDPISYHSDGFMFGGDGTTDYAIKGLYIYNNRFWGDWQRAYTAQIYLNGTPMSCYSFTNGTHEPTANQVIYGETSGGIGNKVYTATLSSGAWDGSGVGTLCMSFSSSVNGEDMHESLAGAGNLIATLSSGATGAACKSTQDTYIWNNILTTSNATGAGESGDKGIKVAYGHDNVNIFNNTIDHSSQTHGGSVCMEYYGFVSNVTIKNNICNGFLNHSIFSPVAIGTNVIDYNIYKTRNNRLINYNNVNAYSTCASAATGLGALFPNTKCSIADPLFTTNITPADHGSPYYSMNNGDLTPAITSYAKGNGVDLSAIAPFTTFGAIDFNGATRTTWDIGAIAYGATEGDTTPPTVMSAIIQSLGTSIIFGFSEQITSTSGAAFTLDTSGAAIALTCPAVTGVNTMTCTTNRTIQQNESSIVIGYSGTKVTDIAINDLAEITSQAGTNNSTIQDPPNYTLTVTKSHCSTSSVPLGIDCGSTCSSDYQLGTVITLYPFCDNGHWVPVYSGDCVSDGTVTMSADKACTITCSAIPRLSWH